MASSTSWTGRAAGRSSGKFAPVAFTLQDFKTTPEGGDFRLSARSQAQEQFDWKGHFALAPIVSSEGEFTIADLRAAGVGEFLGDALNYNLTERLDRPWRTVPAGARLDH